MPTPIQFKAAFYYNANYHLIFKSIDGLLLFNRATDYDLFFHRFKSFTYGLLDVWAYVALQNHTHIIVRVKSVSEVKEYISMLEQGAATAAMKKLAENNWDEALLDTVAERQINSFMVSYVNTVNNYAQKKGGFFQKPFRRLQIMDDRHLQQAIIYVHANAQKHGISNDFTVWPYSSYHSILKKSPLIVNSDAVLTFFGGVDKFVEIHRLQVAYFYDNKWPSSKLEL